MNTLIRKRLVVVITLLSFSFLAKAQTEYLVTVDPVTGIYTKVKAIPPVRWIALFDYTTIDQANHRFFFRGSFNGLADSLFTLDEHTGNTLSAVSFAPPPPLSVISMYYSASLNKLYGLAVFGGICYLVTIDPATGQGRWGRLQFCRSRARSQVRRPPTRLRRR